MRIFKSKSFERTAKKLPIKNADLWRAVAEIESGLIDGNLGGGVYKQRVARKNQGKSGGFRTILFLKSGERAFFVYAFAKKERDNISKTELKVYRDLAEKTLAYDDEAVATLIETGAYVEAAVEVAEGC